MILRRLTGLAAALAAVMAAAACAVVALCFTAYTLLRMIVPPAGAGAIVFGLAAVIAAIAALAAWNSAALPKRGKMVRTPPPTLGEQAMDAVRGHPLAAAGVALAAGVAAFANPALVTAVLRAFTAPPRNRP